MIGKAILGMAVATLVSVSTALGLTSLPATSALVHATTAVTYSAEAQQQAPPADASCHSRGDPPLLWYVMVSECGHDYKGISATLKVPHPPPNIALTAAHSVGQITLEEDTSSSGGACGGPKVNALEAAWVVDKQRNDGKPYFELQWTAGSQDPQEQPGPWNPLPSKDHPQFPQPFAAGSADPQPLADLSGVSSLNIHIDYVKEPKTDGGRWQVKVDNKIIGYYRGNSWGNKGFNPRRASWWGEVMSGGWTLTNLEQSAGLRCWTPPDPHSADATCTSMGNGKPGTDPDAVGFTKALLTFLWVVFMIVRGVVGRVRLG